MVINELRNAVIDTVEFIIPPFIKLIIAIGLANYVTSGVFMHYFNTNVIAHFKSLEVSKIKTIIDNMYLSSIVPIIAILIIIVLAYAVNRISGFIGSLVPLTYGTTSAIRDPYYISQIWKYFPQIQSSYELRLKVTQLISLAKASNLSFPFDQVKWQEEGKKKKFSTINFLSFLLVWVITCYILVHKYLDPSLHSYHLRIIIFIISILIIVMYFRIVRNELDLESAELMIVDNFLRISPEYKKTENLEELEQIKKWIELEKYYNKRWWSLSIGYRLDWLKMYRYYRPPFYWAYIKWKDRKNINKRMPRHK